MPITTANPLPSKALLALYHRINQHLDPTHEDIRLYGPMNLNGDWTLSRLGNDLYNGLSGVLLAYSALYDSLQDAAIKTQAQQIYDFLWHNIATVSGIGMSGIPGLLYTLLCSSHYLGLPQSHLPKLLEKHLNALTINHDSEIDWLNGISGVLTLLVHLQQQGWYRPEPAMLHRMAQQLDHQLTDPHTDHRPMLCGLSHGYSGFALGYAALHQLTGNTAFRQQALHCLHQEDQLWNNQQQVWPDLRNASTCYHHYWCAGSAGIYLARRTIGQWLEQPIPHQEKAYQMTYHFIPQCPNISLCHGLAGLLEVCQQHNSPSDHAMIQRYQNTLLHSDGREAPLHVESPGLMLGTAGLLYQSLRLHNPQRYPCLLLMALPDITP